MSNEPNDQLKRAVSKVRFLDESLAHCAYDLHFERSILTSFVGRLADPMEVSGGPGAVR